MTYTRELHRTRIPLWDLKVSPKTPEGIVSWVNDREGEEVAFVLGHNLHSIYLACVDRDFREFYASSDLTLIDGFPVLLIVNGLHSLRGAKKFSRRYRTGSTDWIPLLNRCSRGFRVALVGASPESNEAALDVLRRDCPGLVFAGWDGYGGVEDLVESGFAQLHEFAPDLVLIGMGMPRQELLLATWRDRLPPSVYATVGGAIDQISGYQNNAPRAFGRVGIEWLWRLAHDPRRMYKRYLIEPFLLLGVTLNLLARRITRRRRTTGTLS